MTQFLIAEIETAHGVIVYLRNKRLFVETSYVTASRKQWVYTDTSGVAWVFSKLQSVKDSVDRREAWRFFPGKY